MILQDLLNKSIKDLTDEELNEGLMMLKKLRVFSPAKKKTSQGSSNQEKQLKDLLSKMPKEKLAEVMELLEKEDTK